MPLSNKQRQQLFKDNLKANDVAHTEHLARGKDRHKSRKMNMSITQRRINRMKGGQSTARWRKNVGRRAVHEPPPPPGLMPKVQLHYRLTTHNTRPIDLHVLRPIRSGLPAQWRNVIKPMYYFNHQSVLFQSKK